MINSLENMDIDNLLRSKKRNFITLMKTTKLLENGINRIEGEKFLIIQEQKCKRCDKKFFPHSTYEGEIRNYNTCPFCKSPYWKLPIIRKNVSNRARELNSKPNNTIIK